MDDSQHASWLFGIFKYSGKGVDLNVNPIIIRLTGLWYGPGTLGKWQSILYGLWTFLVLLFIAGLMTFGISAAIAYDNDIISITSNFCICLQDTGTLLKAALFISRRKALNNLMRCLEGLAQDPVMLRGGANSRYIIAQSARKASIASVIFLFMGFTTFVSWMLAPLILGTGLSCWDAAFKSNNVSPLDQENIHLSTNFSKTAKDFSVSNNVVEGISLNRNISSIDGNLICPEPTFQVEAWFAFDTHHISGYAFGYALVFICGFSFYIVTSTIDSYFVSMMIYISGQMRVLAADIASIKNRIHKTNQEESFPTTIVEEIHKQKMERELIDAIKFHQRIIQSVKMLQDIISTPIFVQFLVSIAVLCTSLYATTQTLGENFPATVKFGTYLLTIFAEILLYCLFGEELKQMNDELLLSAYGCDWCEGSKEFRKNVLFIISRTQRPLTFRGGSFYELSHHTFIQIVNAAYSVFNLLMQN